MCQAQLYKILVTFDAFEDKSQEGHPSPTRPFIHLSVPGRGVRPGGG
jgi:hypothetical protein